MRFGQREVDETPVSSADDQSTISRRHMLMGMGAAGAAAAVGGVAFAPSAGAVSSHNPKPLPSPIPGGIDTGAPNVGFIHWYLPGPTSATSPVLGLQGMGLDVEPSTIVDFKGFSAFAIVAGTAIDGDGNEHLCEFDVRVMRGMYTAASGETRNGAFAFL